MRIRHLGLLSLLATTLVLAGCPDTQFAEIGAAQLEVDPQGLAFAVPPLGANFTDLTVEISNVGAKPLTIESVFVIEDDEVQEVAILDGDDWNGGTRRLEGGESQTMTVRWTVLDAASDRGSISIVTDGGDASVAFQTVDIDPSIDVTSTPPGVSEPAGLTVAVNDGRAGAISPIRLTIAGASVAPLTVEEICLLDADGVCDDGPGGVFTVCAGHADSPEPCDPPAVAAPLLATETYSFTVFYAPANDTRDTEIGRVLIRSNAANLPALTVTVRGTPCVRVADGDVCGTCGDGVINVGEDCDDQNTNPTDDCLNDCTAARCGDGHIWVGVEGCDDGNDDSTDDCAACAPARCGDGFVWAGNEVCDDGNLVETDGCLRDCQPARCGDGIVWEGVETCDDQNDNPTDDCVACQTARCGDGFIWANNEVCDDGNDLDTDDCVGECQPAECGDGFVREGVEACDDGNNSNTDACLSTCVAARCGDGFVQRDVEACDDGDDLNTNGCVQGCVEARCGDGYLWEGVEPCDDGNLNEEDSCTTECRIPGGPFGSCQDLLEAGYTDSGVYEVDPDGDGPRPAVEVFCEMEIDGGGWDVMAYLRSPAQWNTPLFGSTGTVGDTENGWVSGATLLALNQPYNQKIIVYRNLVENGQSQGVQWMQNYRVDAVGFDALMGGANTGWSYRDSYGAEEDSAGNVCSHGCTTYRGWGMFHDGSGQLGYHGTQGGDYGCRDGNNICWRSRGGGCNAGATRCAYLTGPGEGVIFAVRQGPTPPGPPQALVADPGDGEVELTWAAPIDDGGSPVTGYQIYRGLAPGALSPLVLNITPSYVDLSVQNGTTYWYAVAAVTARGEGAPTAPVSAQPAQGPEPPFLTATTDSQVHLSWTVPDDGGSPITSYRVYRGLEPGVRTPLTDLDAEDTAYVDGTVEVGTRYYYTVTAISAVDESDHSNEVFGQPMAEIPSPPLALRGVTEPGVGEVLLSWSAPANDGGAAISAYRIFRDDELLVQVASDVLEHTDTDVAVDEQHAYFVRAVNIEGESPNSNTVSIRVGRLYTSCVDIKNDNPDAADGVYTIDPDGGDPGLEFNVYCEMTSDGGGWEIMAYIRQPSQWNWSFFTDAGTVGDTEAGFASAATLRDRGGVYNQKIIIYRHLVERDEVLGHQWMLNYRPDALPFSAMQTSTGWSYRDSLGFSEEDAGNVCTHNCSTYRGYGMFHDGSGVLRYSGTQTGDYGCRDGNNICWMARGDGCNVGDRRCANLVNDGEGVLYGVRRGGNPPGPPAELGAMAGNEEVLVGWAPPDDNGGAPVTGYYLYRGLSPDNLELLANVGQFLTYADRDVENGTTYHYAVSAANRHGEGIRSATASALPATPPGPPTALTADTTNQVSLSWTAPEEDGGAPITGYNVYRDGEIIETTDTTPAFVDRDVVLGQTYEYRVTTVASGESQPSNTVTATPQPVPPGPPRGLRAESVHGIARIVLNWSAPENDGGAPITGYNVYRDGQLFIALGNLQGWTDTDVVLDQTYRYQLRAVSDAGVGAPSEEVAATAGVVYDSCKRIHETSPEAPSGTYQVDPDGNGDNDPITVYCDMETAGGGWTVMAYIRSPDQWSTPLFSDSGTVGDVEGGFFSGATLQAAGGTFREKIIIYRHLTERDENLGTQWMSNTRPTALPFAQINTATGWDYVDSFDFQEDAAGVGNVCTHGCSTYRGFGMFHSNTGQLRWSGTQGGDYGCRDGNNICWMARGDGCNVGDRRCALLIEEGQGVVYGVR